MSAKPSENSEAQIVPLTLTVPQTAKMMQIGKNQVYELIHAGRLPAIKVTNKFLVVTESLRTWLVQEAEQQSADRLGGLWGRGV